MRIKNLVHVLIASVITFLLVSCNKKEKFENLFDGKTLSGWTIYGGAGDFKVEDSMIVGTCREGVENSFLCSDKEYSDFILEFDVRIDPGINSGMQIRSSIWDKDTTTQYTGGNGKTFERSWKRGTVWGIQVEVDPSERAWSGGFYEEGNRGWIVTLDSNQKARNAFRPNEWNTFRIKADGNHYQIMVNDVLTIDTHDTMSASGFIGMQLHKIYNDQQEGKKVYWKNIRIKKL